jgi:allantoin racemase
MRLYSVTPIHVGVQELARRQARYNALAPDGLTVTLTDLGPDAPRALEDNADVAASEKLVIDALRRAPTDFDVLMPDCVLDPGVDQLMGELPVTGILRLALGWSVLMGRRAAAVTRNRTIADELRRKATAYGWADHLAGVNILGLDVQSISDPARWEASLDASVDRLPADVRTVINGCSAVEVSDVQRSVHVIDPTKLALRLIAAGATS